MKVICERNYNNCIITMGKSYDVIDVIDMVGEPRDGYHTNIYYDIICDDGLQRRLESTRFITLEEHRERIINKILDEINLQD